MENAFSSREVLNIAIKIEQNGHDFYARMAGLTEDPEFKKFFADLAEWETTHKKLFTDMLNQIPDEDVETLSAYGFSEETIMYLNAIADTHVFLKDKDFGLRDTKDIIEALTIAMSLEKDSIIFYYEILAYVSEKHTKTVKEILSEEKKHFIMLSQERKKYLEQSQ